MSLFACTLSFAQFPETKITYQCAGIPARLAIEEISKKSGVSLATSAPIGIEPLIIQVSDVKLKDLLDRIAVAVQGRWAPESNGLTRLVSAKQPNDTTNLKAITERITKSQGFAREQLAKVTEFDAKQAGALVQKIEDHLKALDAGTGDGIDDAGSKLGSEGPMSRLVKRIFVELDPNPLAQLGSGERLVYSTKPNRLQRPIPAKALPAIQLFLKEHEAWKSAIGNRTFQYPRDRGLPTELYYLLQKNMDWGQPSDESLGLPMKVLVFASSHQNSGVSQIEVKLVDSKGAYAASGSLYVFRMGPEERREDPFANLKKGLDEKEPDLQLSATSKEYADRLQFAFRGPMESPPESPSKELEAVLLTPETHDPLSLVMPEVCFQYAANAKVSIVASPPDFCGFLAAAMMAQGVAKPSKVFEMLATSIIDVEVRKEPGWIIVTSQARGSDMPASFLKRADRVVVGSVNRSIKQAGYLTLDTAAEATFKLDDSSDSDISPLIFLVGAYRPDQIELLGGDPMRLRWLKLYGSLNAIQKRTLIAGGELRFGELRPEQQAILTKYVYGVRQGFEFTPRSTESSAHQAFYDGIFGEATERWPNGIPANAKLIMRASEGPILNLQGNQGNHQSRSTMTPEEYGNHLASVEIPNYYGENGYVPPQYDTFVLAHRRKYDFRLELDQEVSTNGSIQESRAQGQKVNSIDQLPPEIKAKILEAKAKAIESFQKRSIPPQFATR